MHSIREKLVWGVMGLAALGLCARLLYLNCIDRSFLLRQSEARILRTVVIPTARGMIVDRNGVPLAISVPVQAIWVNPPTFHPTATDVRQLAPLLGFSLNAFQHWTQKIAVSHKEFIYIKRGVDSATARSIAALHIPGLFFKSEFQRYYPDGVTSAQLLGITNIDNHGIEGLERAYDDWLGGAFGLKQVVRDRLGHVVSDVSLLKPPVPGRQLQLSLDHRIQYLTYQSLQAAVSTYHAESGSAVVLDAKTGEVIAMVNVPSFDPNVHPIAISASHRNRAVTDTFEPGSVIKAFTVAFALASGHYSPDTKINTNPGWMEIGGYRIEDVHNHGVVNLTGLLQKSSNIGAAKILLSLNPSDYFEVLRSLGFGARTESGFPGEVSGVLVKPSAWRPSVVATMAYGYGMSVTTLQLAQAYLTLANDGDIRPLSFVKQQSLSVRRVLSYDVAHTVRHMLEAVLQEGGTGTSARVPGFRVSGKTGTAYISTGKGYNKTQRRYMSSFVGIAPFDHPRLVVAIVIRDPKGQHFGATVAGPVFAQVMGGALRLWGVSPDDKASLSLKTRPVTDEQEV